MPSLDGIVLSGIIVALVDVRLALGDRHDMDVGYTTLAALHDFLDVPTVDGMGFIAVTDNEGLAPSGSCYRWRRRLSLTNRLT